MKIPYELQQEFLKGRVVLFIGSGVTKNYLPAMPSWEELLTKVFATLCGQPDAVFSYTQAVKDASGLSHIHPSDYLRVAQTFELVREERNRNSPVSAQVPSIHRLIQSEILNTYNANAARDSVKGREIERSAELPLFTWVTTNFDTFIEDALLVGGKGRDIAVIARPVTNPEFTGLGPK